MISTIRLKNFQAHTDLRINLNPDITVIAGSSDSGKSSVIRALRWVVFNRPSGAGFVRNGAEQDQCEVNIASDSFCVSRLRKGGENTYKVKKTGKKSQTIRAFGRSMPEDVSAVLNLSEMNFQNQHDSPFLLALSAAEAGRQICGFVDLDEIDRVLSYLRRAFRAASTAANQIDSNLVETEEALKGRKVYTDCGPLISKINRTLKKSKMQEDRVHRLAVEVGKAATAQKELNTLPSKSCLEKANKLVASCQDLAKKGLEVYNRRDALKNLLETISEAQDEIKRLDAVLKNALPLLSECAKLDRRCEGQEQKTENLESLVNGIRAAQKAVQFKERQYQAAEQEFDEQWDTCPACGQSLGESHGINGIR
jgi:DNA repair protein SbcC/Rad50